MDYPAHLKIISKVPNYNYGTKNSCKNKIQEIMQKHDYDKDFIDNIDEKFCEGFTTARDIIIEILEEEYWKKQKLGIKWTVLHRSRKGEIKNE